MTHNEALEIAMGEHKHKKTRKFDGKIYHLHHEEIMSKVGAEGLAEHLRNRGRLVRVVKEPRHDEWLIYWRKN
jgi:hypothetical protein